MFEPAPRSHVLDPAQRRSSLIALADRTFDVLVIGGGIVGCGTALDAASRGLTVALVERVDFAAGTSSRSSKLIHGGLRYLEQLNFELVREGLRERSLLTKVVAPHLVRPLPFLYPVRRRLFEGAYVRAGLLLYDAMAGPGASRHRSLNRRETMGRAPGLDPSFVGALEYWDCQVDDARLTLNVARTAASLGAIVATGVAVDGFMVDDGRVCGVYATEQETGQRVSVAARHVVNATGVWTDDLQDMLPGGAGLNVTASKGVHIVVPRDRFESSHAIITRTQTSVLFFIPWGEHWIVGTTDTEWRFDKAHPVATKADIAYLLDQTNRVVRDKLGPSDVTAVYAGLRPLLAGESEETSRLSRAHLVSQPVPGATVIAGGKYTTYRVMAQDAIDMVVRSDAIDAPPSATDRLPLLGAEGFAAAWESRQRLARNCGLDTSQVERLFHRYGTLVAELFESSRARPDLFHPIAGAPGYLRVEVKYAATHEGARTIGDILSRRTHIAIETADRGRAAAREVARLIAPILGWTDDQVNTEIERYATELSAEERACEAADDEEASVVQAGTP